MHPVTPQTQKKESDSQGMSSAYRSSVQTMLGTHHEEHMLEVELRLWERWEHEEAPNVFGFLELAQDGGFSEVKELYDSSLRWVTAAVLVIFVVYNVYALVVLDVTFIADPTGAVNTMGGTDNEVLTPFYFSTGISDWILRKVTGDSSAHCSSVRIIGALELMGLSVLVFEGARCCYRAKYATGFVKWFSIQTFFWDLLPVLSSYSAMKLLNGVVPAVLLTNISERVVSFQEASKHKRSMVQPLVATLTWLFTVVFGFIIGFDTFLMKMRIVAIKATAEEMSWSAVLPCLQFLVQVLGIVQLGPFVRKRLFVFIFGGEDGQLQEDEIERMETWNALLAKRIFDDLEFSQALAVMLSFSDEDFQKLVFNEDEDKKRAEVSMMSGLIVSKNSTASVNEPLLPAAGGV